MAVWAVQSVWPQIPIDFEAVTVALTGWPRVDPEVNAEYVVRIARAPHLVLSYFLFTSAGSIALGYLLHWVVRTFYLDLQFQIFQFDNEWFYLFSGEALILNGSPEKRTYSSVRLFKNRFQVDTVYASAIVEQGGTAILYWGVLADYFFDRQGRLEKFVLQRVQRRLLSEDRRPPPLLSGTLSSTMNKVPLRTSPIVDDRFYEVDGDFFVIHMSEVKNLNLDYLVLAKSE